jgi:hypothetical protein
VSGVSGGEAGPDGGTLTGTSTGSRKGTDMLTSIRHSGRRVLRVGKYMMGHSPVLLPVLLRLTPEGTARQIGPETTLVIEGFPRSGNTFAVSAVQYLTADQGQIVSHVHHPAQFKRAVQLGLPVLFILRPPLDTLASYLIAGPHGTIPMVMREYCYYHRQALHVADDLVVATFEQVTTDLGAVLARVNRRFGCSLPERTPQGSEVDEIFRRIDQKFRMHHRPDERGMIARPDRTRSEANEMLRRRLSEERHRSWMNRCEEIHHSLETFATSPN